VTGPARRSPRAPAHRRGILVAGCLGLALILIGARAGCCYDSGMTVRVDENRLVDAHGRPIRLLGVNRSGAEYACINNLGFFAGPTDERAIAAMADWRINAVRVPLNEHCWLGINGAPARYSGARYRAAIRAYVARLHEAGLYVLLDLHWNAPGTERAGGQQPMADRDHSPAFWSSVARTFKDDAAVVFDLYNEPHDVTWRCWRDGCVLPEGWRTAGMQTLVDAVRSTGAAQPLIVTAPNWGTDLSSWLEYRPRDPSNQVAAGVHVFDFSFCTTRDCWTRNFEPVALQVPVVATELGQRACSASFIGSFMDWADSAGVSYLGWSWNPAGCAAPALIRSWDGRPTASGALLRARLAGRPVHRAAPWMSPQ
jgi:endoglucanase